MLLVDFYLPVSFFACLAFFIWLVVVAFMRSTKWGWLVLLLSPFSAMVFAYKYWRSAATPFVGYILTLGAALWLTGYLFTQSGGMEMIALMQRMERGELSEAEAQQAMEQIIGRMQASGLVQESDLRKFEELRAQLQALSQQQEDAPPPAASEPTATPVFAIQPKHKMTVAALAAPRRAYRDIPLAEAGQYVGQELQVITENEVERMAVLTGVEGEVFYFQRQHDKGDMAFEMRAYEIRALKILQ